MLFDEAHPRLSPLSLMSMSIDMTSQPSPSLSVLRRAAPVRRATSRSRHALLCNTIITSTS